MKLAPILRLSLFTLASAKQRATAPRIENDRDLAHHGNGMASPKFDIRGWKKNSKGEKSHPSYDYGPTPAPVEDFFAADDPGSYHGGKGYGGKGHKKGTKGTKGSKKSTKKSKRSKLGTSERKSISKKLKESLSEYSDDYEYHYTPSPSESTSVAPSTVPASSSVPATDVTLAPSMDDMLGRVSPRSHGFDNVVQDSSLRTANGARTAPDTDEGVPFDFPVIQRELYPGPIQLKAHSSIDLAEKEAEIFEILQVELSEYLRATAGQMLKRYNLEIIYSPGQDTSHLGVIVTNIDLKCTLLVENSSKEDLVNISHETARGWVRSFFGGPSLVGLLGALRQSNIDVNEIVFLEAEFQSGLFSGNTIAAVTKTGTQAAKKQSSPEEPDSSKNRVGLFSGIFIGILAVSTVLFAHYKGKYPREILGSIRNAFSSDSDSSNGSETHTGTKQKKEVVSARQRSWSGSFRRHPAGGVRPAAIQKQPAFSKNFLKGDTENESSTNEKSKQVLSFLEEQSFSIAEGDYNVPAEYDFKRSPNPSMQSPKVPSQRQSRYQDEEFSMPEDYNTVNEAYSPYRGDKKSPNSSRQSPQNSRGPRRANPFNYGSPWNGSPSSAERRRRSQQNSANSPFGSPATTGTSSKPSPSQSIQLQMTDSSRFNDEWSVDSYDTKTPGASQHHSVAVPYRDWHDAPSPNQRSQLDMPHLS